MSAHQSRFGFNCYGAGSAGRYGDCLDACDSRVGFIIGFADPIEVHGESVQADTEVGCADPVAGSAVIPPRQPDLFVGIAGAGASEQPVLIAVGLDAPERKIIVSGFHGHGLGVAQVVADFIGLGVQVEVGGGDRAAEDYCSDDAHQQQHDDHLDDGETSGAAHRVFLLMFPLPLLRVWNQGERLKGWRMLYRHQRYHPGGQRSIKA